MTWKNLKLLLKYFAEALGRGYFLPICFSQDCDHSLLLPGLSLRQHWRNVRAQWLEVWTLEVNWRALTSLPPPVTIYLISFMWKSRQIIILTSWNCGYGSERIHKAISMVPCLPGKLSINTISCCHCYFVLFIQQSQLYQSKKNNLGHFYLGGEGASPKTQAAMVLLEESTMWVKYGYLTWARGPSSWAVQESTRR